jgi:hypothetical protein
LSTRKARILRGTFGALFALSFLLFAVLLTMRYTVLDSAWYRETLVENDTVPRIYDEILVDPEVKEVTDDLLGNLPVDRSLIDANLRLVIPPDTLRDTLNRTISTLAEYLREERDDIDADFAIAPLARNLERLNRSFIADILNNLQPTLVFGIQDFAEKFQQVQDDVNAGRTPTAFPALPPIAGSEEIVTGILMAPILEPPPGLRKQVLAAVKAGDANGAFALVLPAIRADEAQQATRELREQAGGDEYDYGEEIILTEDGPEMQTVQTVRDAAGDIRQIVFVVTTLVMIGSLVAIVWVANRSGGSWLRTLGVTLIVGGAFVNVVWLIVRLILGDPLSGLTSTMPRFPGNFSAITTGTKRMPGLAFASFRISADFIHAAPWPSVKMRTSRGMP